MNRFLFLFSFFTLFGQMLEAQNVSLCNQVIGSTGFSAVEQNKYWAYTVGEVAIFTLSGNTQDTRVLTQGFHQPDLCLPVSTFSPELADWQIELYPNPASEYFTLQYSPDKDNTLQADVYDVLGNVIEQNIALNRPEGTVIDCHTWQAGLYFLVIRLPESEASASIRLIRL